MKWQFIEKSWKNLKKSDWITKARRALNEIVTEYQLQEDEAAAETAALAEPTTPLLTVTPAQPALRSLAREFLGDAFMVAEEAAPSNNEEALTLDEQLREYFRDRSQLQVLVTVKAKN
ncbi:hypothetical protein LTR74_018973, partial [Friedmanniomyces endolithicus]